MRLPFLDRDHILALAPMDDITDGTARRLAHRFGADLVYTEFISAEGLIRDAAKSLRKLHLARDDHPVAIQVFGSHIPSVVEAARVAEQTGPECIDLNFGCPARKVAGRGSGAGLLRTPEKLEQMARAVVAAVALPVTAKVRLGWDEQSINVLDVCRRLEQSGIVAVAVHARTRSQSYSTPAEWDWIARVKQAISIPVIGNGDVREPQDAERMFRQTGCDGVMIGRAALGNPWLFRRIRHYLETGNLPPCPSLQERIAVLLDHLNDAAAEKTELRAVLEMRKTYSGYLKGLPGAARLRASLMKPLTIRQVVDTLGAYQQTAC
ncbi:MAG: tRNA dihydrouridine synthase DusB [Candidatus Eisenbacteria sp.]|nr:tRNA dihydrouridine synthase DusB [Candidatus Eisenbacteria bacterium]